MTDISFCWRSVCYRVSITSRTVSKREAHRLLSMQIGNCALFTLEVMSDGGTTRDPNDHIHKQSAEKRPGRHGRKLLQFSRRKTANETGRLARGVPSENSRANH